MTSVEGATAKLFFIVPSQKNTLVRIYLIFMHIFSFCLCYTRKYKSAFIG